MSMLSPVDAGKLLVYSRLLPVPFRKRLLEMGLELLEVPEEEYPTMACNVLAMAPGKCLALAGNPRTQDVLAKAWISAVRSSHPGFVQPSHSPYRQAKGDDRKGLVRRLMPNSYRHQ